MNPPDRQTTAQAKARAKSARVSRPRRRPSAIKTLPSASVEALVGGGVERSAEDVRKLLHELQVHHLELEAQCDELRRIQQALQTAHDRYADLFDFAPVAHLVLSPENEILEASLGAAELLGLERSHLLRQKFTRFVGAEAQEKFYFFVGRIFRSPGRQSTDLNLVTARHQRLVVHVEAVRDAKYPSKQCRFCCTDITEHKQAEQQLRKLWRAVEQNPASIVITDVTGAIEYVNPKFTRVTGYSADEVRGQNPRILKSGESPAEFYQQLWQTLLRGQEWRGEFHNRKKNGELYWEFALISPIKADDGKITHFVAVKEDITEGKLAQLVLQESEVRLRLLTNATYEGVCFSENGRVYDVNDQIVTMLGYSREELIGKVISDLVAPASRTLVMEAIRAGREERYEHQMLRKDGSVLYIEAQAKMMQLGNRTLRVTALRDITERKRLEEKLRTERERWERETLRRIEQEQERIGRDLHDGLCQILVGAKLQVGALAQRLAGQQNSAAVAAASAVEHMINRTIHQARDLAKGLNPVKLETNGLVFALEELAKDIQATGIARCHFKCDAADLMFDRNAASHLYRIAQEAVQNAIKHGQARKISLQLRQRSGQLLLRIGDNGLGFSATPEKWVGAGLHNMRMRAAMIGGTLAIRHRRGGGSVVTVRLPLREQPQ